MYMRELGEGQFGKILLMKAKVLLHPTKFMVNNYFL